MYRNYQVEYLLAHPATSWSLPQTNGDLDYAINNLGIFPNLTNQIARINPNYDWGWGFNIGYAFPQTGNDIEADYFRFSTYDNNGFAGNFTPLNFTGPFDDVLPFVGFPFDLASATAQYDIHQADIVGGQYIDVGCRFTECILLPVYAGQNCNDNSSPPKLIMKRECLENKSLVINTLQPVIFRAQVH